MSIYFSQPLADNQTSRDFTLPGSNDGFSHGAGDPGGGRIFVLHVNRSFEAGQTPGDMSVVLRQRVAGGTTYNTLLTVINPAGGAFSFQSTADTGLYSIVTTGAGSACSIVIDDGDFR